MTDSFPITLAFPPQGHFTQPYLALPCIQAWLKQQGFDDVEQTDDAGAVEENGDDDGS